MTSAKQRKLDERNAYKHAARLPALAEPSSLFNSPKRKVFPHDYVCVPRPFEDCMAEEKAKNPRSFEAMEKAATATEKREAKAFKFPLGPAADHKEWKWIIQLQSLLMFLDYKNLAEDLHPFNNGMMMITHEDGWMCVGLVQAMMEGFNKEMQKTAKKKDLDRLWGIVAAIAHWLYSPLGIDLLNVDDAEGVAALIRLIGSALLAALAALDKEGFMEKESRLFDLPLVISLYLAWVVQLPDYGIEGDDVAWASIVASSFQRAGFSVSKGVSNLPSVLEQAANLTFDDEDELSRLNQAGHVAAWPEHFQKYMKEHKVDHVES